MATKTITKNPHRKRGGIEVEIPRRIAYFLRERFASRKSDREMIEGIVKVCKSKANGLNEEEVRELVRKYFKEAERDYLLRHLFDNDVFSALEKVLGEEYKETIYREEELGIDEKVLEKLRKIDMRKFADKKMVIKSMEEFERKLKEQILFIKILSDESVIKYDDYGAAKLRLRTIRVFLSQQDIDDVYDFLKMVDEILSIKSCIRKNRSAHNDARLIRRVSVIFRQQILSENENLEGVKELLDTGEELILIENIRSESIQKEIVKMIKEQK